MEEREIVDSPSVIASKPSSCAVGRSSCNFVPLALLGSHSDGKKKAHKSRFFEMQC